MDEQTLSVYVENLTAQCRSHADWLQVVRFGMGTLREHPRVLTEVVCAEAQRESARQGQTGPLHELKRICDELGLRFVAA